MRSIVYFIVKPKSSRYNNTKDVDGKELILNSEIYTHQSVSREAIVTAVPTIIDTEVKKGDEVIVHHNIFRRYNDVRGIEKNSASYIGENKYFVNSEQIYAYKRDNKWKALKGYCFVKPIKSNNDLSINKEKPLVGVVKFLSPELIDLGFRKNDLVGFSPNSEYEFTIDNERLYRVTTNSITIKYEYQGKEEEYNPSWV
jgi:hypothetical protein